MVTLKGNAQFIFLCNPQKSLVIVCFMKILKSTATKKVRKHLKVVAFVILPISIMVLFEIHQRFKGYIMFPLKENVDVTGKAHPF